MKKFLSTLAVTGLAVFALASCTGDNKPADNGGGNGGNGGNGGGIQNPTKVLANGDVVMSDELANLINEEYKGTYNVRVWVSETEGVTDLTTQQIAKFDAMFPNITIVPTVDPVSESEAAGKMITDVNAGADVYCFAQDQLARLVQAKALSVVSSEIKSRVQVNNDAGAFKAGSTAGELYAFPLTSDNGYFLYYDKSVVKEESLGDIIKIMDDCNAAGKKFSYNITGGGWYTGGVFFGAGCTSQWTTNQGGFFMNVEDDFKTKGMLAAKAIHLITNHPAYNAAEQASEFSAGTPSAAVVSGTWDSGTAKEKLGDNYAACELPSVTVDGKTFHLGSFSGNKLMGVKPQGEDLNKQVVCQLLAEYLTLCDQQLERFAEVGWGPSNVNAQKNEEVKKDVALSALAAQGQYATPQGQIQGDWWTIVTTLAKSCQSATTDEELQAALDTYDTAIRSKITTDFKTAGTWGLIGEAVGDWSTDIVVAEPDDNGITADGIYTITVDGTVDGAAKIFVMEEGKEFKLRRGFAWGNESNKVKEGSEYLAVSDKNIKVLVSGSYKIQVSIKANAVEWVELVPAE